MNWNGWAKVSNQVGRTTGCFTPFYFKPLKNEVNRKGFFLYNTKIIIRSYDNFKKEWVYVETIEEETRRMVGSNRFKRSFSHA